MKYCTFQKGRTAISIYVFQEAWWTKFSGTTMTSSVIPAFAEHTQPYIFDIYIPKMSRVVKCYVNECAVCQTSKLSHESSLGPLYPIPAEEPCHTLSLDFITGLPVSQWKDALFTITDKFMKAMCLITCNKDTDIIETAKLYLKYCYPVFSLLFKIISDQDVRFTSRFWMSLMHLLDINQGMTTAFIPVQIVRLRKWIRSWKLD